MSCCRSSNSGDSNPFIEWTGSSITQNIVPLMYCIIIAVVVVVSVFFFLLFVSSRWLFEFVSPSRPRKWNLLHFCYVEFRFIYGQTTDICGWQLFSHSLSHSLLSSFSLLLAFSLILSFCYAMLSWLLMSLLHRVEYYCTIVFFCCCCPVHWRVPLFYSFCLCRCVVISMDRCKWICNRFWSSNARRNAIAKFYFFFSAKYIECSIVFWRMDILNVVFVLNIFENVFSCLICIRVMFLISVSIKYILYKTRIFGMADRTDSFSFPAKLILNQPQRDQYWWILAQNRHT